MLLQFELRFVELFQHTKYSMYNNGKTNLTFHTPFSVHPQPLRKRQERKTYCFNRSKLKSKQKQHTQTHNYTQITSTNYSLNTSTKPTHNNVNWLKYNILVGIYENWVRLYPYIQHLLDRFPSASTSISQELSKFEYLKRKKAEELQANSHRQDGLKNLMESIKLRRLQIIQKVSQVQENGVDGQMIELVNYLAQQLLNTLSIQNIKWNKHRIQKHNRLLDEALNKFTQKQFAANSSAILESLKERLEFITKIQESYTDAVKVDPKYKQKLASLKQPFQKGILAAKGVNRSNMEQKLQRAWNQLKKQKFNKSNLEQKDKKKSKHNERFTVVTRTDSNSLIIKYKNKKNDHLNDTYIKSKINSSQKKKRNKQNQNGQNEDSQSEHFHDLHNSSAFIKEPQNPSRKSIVIHESIYGKQTKQDQLDKVDSFMGKTRQKIHKDFQASVFNRSKINRKQQVDRPSISYFQAPKLQKQSINRKSFSEQAANRQKRVTVHGRGSTTSKFRPSIQNLFDEVKEEYVSRFKSHKKIVTAKNLKGAHSKVRLTKESKNSFRYRESRSKFKNSEGKIDREVNKRQFFTSNRKGNLLRKCVFRKVFENDRTFDQILTTETGDFNYKRAQILAYLSMIKQRGFLEEQKYTHLKKRVSQLISKHSASVKAANKEYAKKVCQKSMRSEYYELPEEYAITRELRRDNLLKQLSSIICNDERVQMKIKQQMKIYYDQNVDNCSSQGESGNQHYVFSSVESGNIQQQLKRLLQFQQQNKTVSLANILKNIHNKLEQKDLQ